MAEVKWIKIVTDVFDDEKILMIETLPDADSIIVIWFKLLCLAGKQNNGGVFLLGRMPYTDEMFATVFRRPINTVRLALKTFVDYGMIEIINNAVTIPNWDKHQSLDAYEKKKERDRLYRAERRAAQKQIAEKSSDSRLTVARQSSDKSSDVASQIRIDKKETREEEIIHSERNAHACARGEGAHGCVFLTDEEREELYNRLGAIIAKQYIKRLDQFIFEKGATVADHFNTILKWWEEDNG